MPLVIQDKNAPPVEGWSYRIAATGHTVTVTNGSFNRLWNEIVKHCNGNNVGNPNPQDVIDYVCKHLHVRCYEADNRIPLINKHTLGVPYKAKGCCGDRKK